MRLGLNIGYTTTAELVREGIQLAREAETIGYQVVWTAEAYGSDSATILAAVAATTERIGIGAGVFQIPGRSPAMTAMTAATLDAISSGRMHLGLGVSGPQVSEGWHGVRFADPLGRTREYVQIVRQALARERVQIDGRHFTLPLPDGQGKSLMLSLHSERTEIPVYLAAVGPKNLDLTGEIADGWLAIFFDVEGAGGDLERIRTSATAAGRDPRAIDIAVSASASVASSPAEAGRRVRPMAALYIGGMGSRTTNFYHRLATNMGYSQEADTIQDRYLARDYGGAAKAVPQEFLERTSLIGDQSDIAAGLRRLADAGVSTVNISPHDETVAGRIETLRVVMDAARSAGVLS